MTQINLYKIKRIVQLLFPLYVSICAALLIEVKSNLKFDLTSISYFIGLISFFIACSISNDLNNICNSYENIYITKLFEYDNKRKDIKRNNIDCTIPDRKNIYNNEKKIKNRLFKYYGVFIFGVFGFICIIFSNISQKNQHQRIIEKNIMLQQHDSLLPQVDSSKVIDIEQSDELN
jgi:hypothetical protein